MCVCMKAKLHLCACVRLITNPFTPETQQMVNFKARNKFDLVQ